MFAPALSAAKKPDAVPHFHVIFLARALTYYVLRASDYFMTAACQQSAHRAELKTFQLPPSLRQSDERAVSVYILMREAGKKMKLKTSFSPR
jgi:hypothetical protein